ncbi:MAG: hypothetical protein DHS20C18_03040 [Saprospiraceae bacterium]|nr:MAG: hypothetical protein DHS20C18_03040 [Saprospiraceae bacterium]
MVTKNFTLFICLFFALSAFGQTPFWTEDFADGLPNGWVNEDLSGNNVLWTWCANPETPNAPGCPAIFVGQDAFNSTTGANGFVAVDSDDAGELTHESELTTNSIDCSAYDEVWITFETQIGVFMLEAATNAVLNVSNDGGENWTEFTIFPGMPSGVDWSANPENITINLSAVAANQSDVIIQWHWLANYEYIWNIDDIALYGTDPRPATDLQVDGFFAVAPNAVTPISQIEPIGFIADVTNRGSADQVSSTLTVTVTNSNGDTMFTDMIEYDMIASDSTDQNRFFENQFTPPAVVDQYTVTYEIAPADTDQNPSNNTQSYTFSISDGQFAKHRNITGSIVPLDDNNYTYGNVFYVPNGENLHAQSITFGASADQGQSLDGRIATTYLYKWSGDINEDFYANVVEMENESPVAFNSYQFSGSDDGEEITIPIDLDAGSYPLEGGFYYIAAVQYQTDLDEPSFTLSSGDYDYAAMNFYTDSLEMERYAGALDIGNTGEFNLFNFGFDIVPAISMNIGLSTDVVETLLPAGSLRIFPNPANQVATAKINLQEQTSSMDLKLVDVNGKTIFVDKLNNVQEQDYTFDVKNLPNGNYFLRARTEQGIATVKVVVQH